MKSKQAKFTAEQARSCRLKQETFPSGELDRILWEIERVCYLQDGLYWRGTLTEETISALIALGYRVENKCVCGGLVYMIDWIY